MLRPRLTMLLPSVSVIVTSVLWMFARTQYLRFVCPPAGACPPPNGWVASWTDYTPFSLLVAGMLNIPVAIFGAPLYHLLHERTANSELIALLVGLAVLWSYIGWILDTRNTAPRPKSILSSIAGTVGFLFGIFLFIATLPMFHVGPIYKAVTLVWVFLICRHSLLLCRNSTAASRHMSTNT
jgi:hypothetical protein